VGKTRLLREVLARVREQHPAMRVLVARPSSLARLSAFSTLRSGLRGHLRGSARATQEVALRPLLAELQRLGNRELGYQNDPVLALDRVRDLLDAWVTAEGASDFVPPTLFVVDDLHFADAPSLQLLMGLKRHLPDVPFVLVGAGREEPGRSPLSEVADLTLSLEPLPDAAARELALVVGGPEVDADAIATRALGNPFVVEELARLARTGASAGLPETVLSLLQARLDALLPAEKRYAAFASVFGPTFSVEGVTRILGDPRDVVEHVTERLVSVGILEAHEGQEDDVFAFKSELLREAAYESLVDADRAEAHRRVASFLEAKGLAEPMLLARHFELAHLPARAARHFVGAAELALFGNDFAGALSCARAALDAGVVDAMRGRAELVVAEVNRWKGELALARGAAERAADSFPRGSMEWFFATRERIAALGRLGEIGKIPALVDETFAASVEPGAESAQIAALVPAIIHLLYAGDLAAAKELAARLDTDAVDPASLLPFARARMYQLRAGLSQYDGNLAGAVRNQELARAEFHEARDQRGFALATSNLAFTLMTLGENERAEALCRDTIRLAERLSLATVLPLAQQNLGTIRARRGFYEEAVTLQSGARAAFEARRDPRLAGVSSIHLALALDRLGRHSDALSEVARVLWGGFESLQFAAFAAKATVELSLGRIADAVDSARTANARLDELGSVEEFEIKTRLVLAEALYATGEATLALEALERVRARLERWAGGLGDPGLVPAFYWNVPEHARVLELSGITKGGGATSRLIP
jgi:tetratricopeptide (TPR) repeat protein